MGRYFSSRIILTGLGIWLGFGLTQEVRAEVTPGSTNVICYHQSNKVASKLNPSLRWTWARNEKGDYFQLSGYWLKSKNSKTYFLSDRKDADEISKSCRNSISQEYSEARELINWSAKKTIFLPGYDIVFANNSIVQDLIGELSHEVPFSNFRGFLNVAKQLLESLGDGHVLGGSLFSYLKQNPQVIQNLLTYLEQAEKWEKIRWSSAYSTENQREKFKEFISLFASKTDYEVLSYQLEGSGGPKRGAFNSYIDMVTDIFKPDAEQNPVMAPGLYQSTSNLHKRVYALTKVFSIFASLRQNYTTLLEIGQVAEPLTPQQVERFLTVYQIYSEMLDLCRIELGELEKAFDEDWDSLTLIMMLRAKV